MANKKLQQHHGSRRVASPKSQQLCQKVAQSYFPRIEQMSTIYLTTYVLPSSGIQRNHQLGGAISTGNFLTSASQNC
jgi:hypothetical protein